MAQYAVLAVNAGSSSLKAAVYDVGEGVAPRLLGRIHLDRTSGHATTRGAGGETQQHPGPASGRLPSWLLELTEAMLDGRSLAAVGHRVVHGGRVFREPTIVTPEVLEALSALALLAPLHQPDNLSAIGALRRAHPHLPQVACFDTAFHRTIDPLAARFALPRALHDEGIRRYGFHGLSYNYVARRLGEVDPELAQGRVIAAHLGAGASLCAMAAGRSVDTSMGFSALDGLMMSTRCGTLDPGVVLHLIQQKGMCAAEVEDLLYRRSGLLGVSGLSADVRDLLSSDDPAAREAIELYGFRAAREAGALAASLGGLDGLVFTGGVGEHAPEIRARIVTRLAWLGAAVDETANAAAIEGLISPAGSAFRIWVIPTDEEQVMAEQTVRALGPSLFDPGQGGEAPGRAR